MAGVLLLCTLLLSTEVMCQDDDVADPTDAPTADDTAVTDAANSPAAPDASAAPDAGANPTDADSGDSSAATAAPGDDTVQATVITMPFNADSGDGDAAGVTDAPAVVTTAAPEAKPVVPEVKCVAKEAIPEGSAVKAEVATNDCESTKDIIQQNPAPWCNKDSCNLEISQDGNNLLMASKDAELGTLVKALQGEQLKNKLGVTKTETPSSSGSSVFVGILVTGLLAALAITVGYFKCQRKPDAKGVRLAEEAYPADQENQGNTLVSVAPLNPPPETQEKPSVNGESPEAAKTQPPPPTNGHSTAKTADTEL